jgi:spore germination cell wall hydrolase CwlJ-like protein
MSYEHKKYEYKKQDLETLAKTIYGEARGEFYRFGPASLIAVANVAVNRKEKGFSESVHDVCLAPYQFSCWNRNDPNRPLIVAMKYGACPIFDKCWETAENVLSGKWPDLTDGCDHYHERSLKPYWATYRKPKRIFGRHFFYVLSRNRCC